MRKKIFYTVFTIFLFLFVLVPAISLAEESPVRDLILNETRPIQDVFGGKPPDIRTIAANVIKILIGLLGIIYIIYVLYGGYLWLTSGGEEEKIRKGKSTIVTGAIGVGVILMAYAIARFVVTAFGCAVENSANFCSFLNQLL